MKAYLAWPVKLKGNLAHNGTHITLKYIGEIKDRATLLKELDQRIIDQELTFKLPLDIYWMPEKFNPSTHVMVIHNYDANLMHLSAAVSSLRKDDYTMWRPHITMDPSIWKFIWRGKLSIQYCIEEIGPLTLYVDKKPVMEYK